MVSHSVDDFQSDDLVQPLDKTAPGAKASASGPYDEVQQLADKAKEQNVDPTVLVVQQLIQPLKTPAQQQPQPYVPPQPKRRVDKTVLKCHCSLCLKQFLSIVVTVTDKVDDPQTATNAVITPLNCHDEEDIVTQGIINGIHTSIVIDSGAKISLISTDFVTDNLTPISTVTIHCISQIPHSVPVYQMSVELPSIKGVCQLAADDRLPNKTVLIGTDFGKDNNMLSLIHSVKSTPIPDVTVTNAHETALEHDDTLLTALDETSSIEDITPSGMNTDETVPANTSTNVCKALSIPMEIPTLSFDGISKDVFKQLQTHDISLQPLWDQTHKGNKQFFIIDGLLMCLASTLNTVSHALVVPQQLKKKVLIAAHDGLGHGGINTTRTLLNKHFTWPGLADNVRKHLQACQKCLKHTKSLLRIRLHSGKK